MAFDPNNHNLAVWLREEPTDPAHTKGFSRGGGFKGTAINATFVMKRLTAAFGPVGWGWGYRIRTSREVVGAPISDADRNVIGHEIVQVTEIDFWYYPFGRADMDEQRRAEFQQVGQTTFVSYSRKNAYFLNDEEAWKKSLTDAITKAASHIGIGADIHLGLFDDNKYLATRTADEGRDQANREREAAAQAAAETARIAGGLADDLLAAQNAEAFAEIGQTVRACWPDFNETQRKELTIAVGKARARLGIPEPAKKAA